MPIPVPLTMLIAQPLTAAAFTPFGQVVAVSGAGHAATPRAMLAVFRSTARNFPLQLVEMERHALGSQTFIPLGMHRFVVVVAAAGSACSAGALQAFVTNGQQGVLLAPGTWHHALLAVEGR